MPRLTSQDYLAQRRLLIEEWYEHDAVAFGDTPIPAQHDLHDFYAPTEPLSDADALKHRAAMTRAFPSLPQKAGRAFQMLIAVRELKALRGAEARTSPRKPGAKRGIRIAPVVRPKTDLRLLAKVLVKLSVHDADGALLKKLQEAQKRKPR